MAECLQWAPSGKSHNISITVFEKEPFTVQERTRCAHMGIDIGAGSTANLQGSWSIVSCEEYIVNEQNGEVQTHCARNEFVLGTGGVAIGAFPATNKRPSRA